MKDPKEFKIVVIGGGHAGIEAALAAARLGLSTALVSLKRSGIGQMSCNPAIGGLGKGHLVKEVDALGGLMGRAIDATGIQFRTLNSSKGPAVRASRAQADRDLYKAWIQTELAKTPNLTILEAEVSEVLTRDHKVTGIKTADGSELSCEALIVTTGTFLRGLMHTGPQKISGGRNGDSASNSLSDSLKRIGFELGRLKTGTPPRLQRLSIDFSILKEQPGETPPRPFSIMTKAITRPQISCWITSTNEATHDLIRANRERSPMFNGQITSGGPRYCPSIEDKVYRFADKTSHNIFLEPEGFDSDIVYPNGISTSLPQDVQEDFVRTIPGLSRAKILQYGYAVEYDFVDPRHLKPSLETKLIQNLFFAGQINGTSGYEEAAAQGIIAGANAALKILEREALIIERGMGYIGVMIDDLTTCGVDEPYRMFTSRAEYRLILREDNASSRLSPTALKLGLLGSEQSALFIKREQQHAALRSWSAGTRLKPSELVNNWLGVQNSAILKDSILVSSLVRRPEISLESVLGAFFADLLTEIDADLLTALEIELKFSGYLSRQEEEVQRLRKMESEHIPSDFAYETIAGLRIEALEKLKKVRPFSIGQAMRIPGITPSTVSLLAVHLKRHKDGSRTIRAA